MDFKTENAELHMLLDKLTRKVDFLYRAMNLEYPDEAVPTYVLRAQELVSQGRDLEAIKIVREQTAVGMSEARAIIEDLARRVGRTAAVTLDSVVPPMGVAGARSNIDPSSDQAAVEDAWRRAVRESEAQRT